MDENKKVSDNNIDMDPAEGTEKKEQKNLKESEGTTKIKKRHIFLYALEGIVFLAVLICTIFIFKLTRAEKLNIAKSEIKINTNYSGGEDTNVSAEAESDIESGDEKTPKRAEEVEAQKLKEAEQRAQIEKEMYEKSGGKFMLAFFGVDSREGDLGKGTRSDSMMICSIDMDTHEVRLVSIYRDAYLNLGNGSYNKCNAAYAIGGPVQAMSMINVNTDLYVSDYVTVGFEGLVDAIDALGGVPIEVTEEEMFHLNNYQMTMAEQLGVEYKPVVFPGMQVLNGLQATAYCRIRYTKGYDFKRTERQRTVLTAMLERCSHVSLSALTSAITSIMPNVSTSLSLNDIISMLSLASDYEVTVSDGFPFTDKVLGATVGEKGSCIIPNDLTSNVKKLHKVLFDDDNYEPSAEVKKYSNQIKENVAEYIP